MDRRDVLRLGGAGLGATLAGCLDGFERTSAWRDPPLVENRPQAVYVPAITEGMALIQTATVGAYKVALSYSYPHRFWNVQSDAREKVTVTADDSVHLMASVWDRETGIVVPSSGVSLEIHRDESLVSQEVIYPMLSQQMGFHYGANFPLDGEGEYQVRLSIGGLSMPRTGAFTSRFGDPLSVELPFTFDTDALYDLSIRRLGERQGQRAAIEPMDMGVPSGVVPDIAVGSVLGTAVSGDAQFTARLIRDAPRFGGGTYLAVTAHTPYNRIVLPMMQLSGEVTTAAGNTIDISLSAALDSTLGYHYGVPLEKTTDIEHLTLTVDLPPQVARHDGYETAFFEMPAMTIGQ
ncbi:iron transporter [Halomarina oriensis]|uniref:Iron transporter n=1 Tax=Halomarina oriensis TaxID=671145 RepID=A0A6B0GPD7_9EURY|nr:iron transporter [Halomarina oriensis]MWG35367.1 iron transporter [Halomarina oriensis]